VHDQEFPIGFPPGSETLQADQLCCKICAERLWSATTTAWCLRRTDLTPGKAGGNEYYIATLSEYDYLNLNLQIPRHFTQIKNLPSNLSASSKHTGWPFKWIQQWTTDSTSTTAKASWRESREMGCLKPGMPTRREWSIVGWTVMDIFLHRPPRSDNVEIPLYV
jgi:hypothetical protein